MDYLWLLEPETEYNASEIENDALKNKFELVLTLKKISIFLNPLINCIMSS